MLYMQGNARSMHDAELGDQAGDAPEALLQPMEVENLAAHAEDYYPSHAPSVDRSRVALATLEQILVAETWLDSTKVN